MGGTIEIILLCVNILLIQLKVEPDEINPVETNRKYPGKTVALKFDIFVSPA